MIREVYLVDLMKTNYKRMISELQAVECNNLFQNRSVDEMRKIFKTKLEEHVKYK